MDEYKETKDKKYRGSENKLFQRVVDFMGEQAGGGLIGIIGSNQLG